MPLTNGYGAYVVASTTFTPPAVRVVGDQVELAGGLVSYSSAAPLAAGTTYALNTGALLDAAYRPLDTHVAAMGAVHYAAAPTLAEVRITKDGLVQYIPAAAGSLSGTTATWIVVPSMRWRLA